MNDTFRLTHVATGIPGFVHHVPCTPIPGLGEFDSVDGRGPLLAVTTDGLDTRVFPARCVAPSVHTIIEGITGCTECADLLTRSLERNSLHHLSAYFAMAAEGGNW